MVPPELHHLIYTSAATGPIEREGLVEILAAAREKNARLEVTGMLLFSSGTFFQILEGRQETIDLLFARIGSDDRHRAVTRIIHEPIATRDFGEWTMGFAGPGSGGPEAGLSDFFEAGTSHESMPAGRARSILAAFGRGRWRATLSAPIV